MRDMGTEREEERVAWAREFIGELLYRQLECPAVHECDEDRSKEMDF